MNNNIKKRIQKELSFKLSIPNKLFQDEYENGQASTFSNGTLNCWCSNGSIVNHTIDAPAGGLETQFALQIEKEGKIEYEDGQASHMTFNDLEVRLNKAKGNYGNIIKNKQETREYLSFMRLYDIYSNLKEIISRDYNGQKVTNAWLKCYEMISKFGLIYNRDVFRTFSNAEFVAELL